MGPILIKFQNSKFSDKNISILFSFASVFENVNYFNIQQKEIKKIRKWHHHIYMFLGHCTVKKKDMSLKACTGVVCIYLDNMYSVFWISWKFWFFWAAIFEKLTFWFLGSKLKRISIIGDSHFIERLILRLFSIAC